MAGLGPELLCTSRLCLRHTPKQLIPRTRAFTTTPVRRKHGSIPTFHTTSSANLDALLATFRSNVFLPSQLLLAQRGLIYRKTRQPELLGEDPITVDMPVSAPSSPDPAPSSSSSAAESDPKAKTESFTLVPLDHLKDEPATKASFHQVLSLLATAPPRDWAVLPGFLEGLKASKRKVTSAMAAKLIRHAADAGRMGVVIDCVRQVDRTGVRLSDVALAREVMWGAVQTAIRSEWSALGVGKATRQARGMVEMMEDPRHVGVRQKEKGRKDRQVAAVDPRRAPEVLGVLLCLEAIRVVKYGVDGDKVLLEALAQKVLGLWPHVDLDVGENSRGANRALMMWAPVEVGLRATIGVLGEGSPLGKKLGQVLRTDVAPVVEKARGVLEADPPAEGQRRGMALHEELKKVLA